MTDSSSQRSRSRPGHGREQPPPEPDVAPDALARLVEWDTPTICNALEIVCPERRGYGFTTETFHVLAPEGAPMVGIARTATIKAMTPAPDSPEEARETRLRYYRHVAARALPTIAVLQDLDPVPGFGAFWGEVNTTVHKGLGVAGAITNGSMRDLDACAPGFQLLAGKIGPSHAHVHVVEIGVEVEIYGMRVHDGDLIHADRHGAVVVPAQAVAKLPEAAELLSRREAVTLAAARRPDFDVERLAAAMAEAQDIH